MKVNDEKWKEKLTNIQYEVARLGGTERAFSGSLNLEKRKGNSGRYRLWYFRCRNL